MPNFTDQYISRLTVEPGRKDRLVFDAKTRGLGVRVSIRQPKTEGGPPQTIRTFLVQWTDKATRQKRREPLGQWGSVTIEAAREAAKVKLGEVAKGIDPRAVRLQQRKAHAATKAEEALTFEKLIDDWASIRLSERRPSYAVEAVRALKHTLAKMLKRPAAHITRNDAVNALDALVKNGRRAMAGRVMAYGRACYRWAQKRGKVEANPFQGLPIEAGCIERDRVLTDEELGRVWNATATLPAIWQAFYRLAILTLQRREEVAGMRWSELTPDLTTWAIPANRMKNGKPHIVFLTEAAREALGTMPRVEGRDLIFTTTGKTHISGFSKAKVALDTAAEVTAWRLHDMRRTGATAMAAMGIDHVVADKVLAHKEGAIRGVARVYQRYDYLPQREAALKAWAAHVARCAKGKEDQDNVVQLRAG